MKKVSQISNVVLGALAAVAAGMVFYFMVTFFGIVSALTVLGYMLFIMVPVCLAVTIMKSHKRNSKKATRK